MPWSMIALGALGIICVVCAISEIVHRERKGKRDG